LSQIFLDIDIFISQVLYFEKVEEAYEIALLLLYPPTTPESTA
jgi:hypothetical protein